MMTAVTGELGTGKTYQMAKHLYRRAARNYLCISNFRHVYSNIIVQNDAATLMELIRQLAQFKQRGYELCDLLPTFTHTGVYFAIDEAHLVFGRDRKIPQMEEVILPFLSLARKQSVDIWYVCQDPATIHKTFRRYTQITKYMRPIVPFFRNKLVPHPTRPIMQIEKRLLFPFVWEEDHELDYENPVFNLRRQTDPDTGFTSWHQSSTIKRRRIVKNSDPFIHSLYNSNETSGVNINRAEAENFDLLRKHISYIEHNYKKPLVRLPFSKMPQLPTRREFKEIDLPVVDESRDLSASVIKQPIEFLDDLSFFLSRKGQIPRLQRRRLEADARAEKKARTLPPAPEFTTKTVIADALAHMEGEIAKDIKKAARKPRKKKFKTSPHKNVAT